MHLREVTINDKRLLFEWANDPLMRANSFNSEEISWSEHIRWFEEKMNNKNTKIFIVEDEFQNPIGQIRFEKENNYAIIDFYLIAGLRGKGLGSILLNDGSKIILDIWNDIDYVLGKVKKNNIPSRKSFIKAGFKEFIEKDIYIYIKDRDSSITI